MYGHLGIQYNNIAEREDPLKARNLNPKVIFAYTVLMSLFIFKDWHSLCKGVS